MLHGSDLALDLYPAVATYPGFTEYERVYVTFKLTEQIAWSLRSPADDEEDDEGPE